MKELDECHDTEADDSCVKSDRKEEIEVCGESGLVRGYIVQSIIMLGRRLYG